MTETEAIMEIVRELRTIHIMLVMLAFINSTLWIILVCKRCYSDTDGIKDAIKELISLIKSRR